MSRFEFLHDGDPLEVTVERNGENHAAEVEHSRFSIRPIGGNQYVVDIDGRRVTVSAAFQGDTCFVDIESVLLELKEPSEDGFAGGAGDASAAKDKVFAPMPGKIVKIMVEEGQAVEVKQAMVIVEAMIIELEIEEGA
jgi:3-methylcrotonyl-CoA carboxylase alpha subunit